MSVQGNVSENLDKSHNYSLGVVRDDVSASIFMNNYKDKNPVTQQPIAPSFSSVGASLGVDNSLSAASVKAQHIPTFGNQITCAASTNLSEGLKHRVDVNAFTTANMPKAGPNFMTHGGGIDAQVGRVGANASVAHTPMYKATEYAVGGRLNLIQSPTASAHLNVGASKVVTPFSNGPWQPGVYFGVTRKF